jgi:hypothetical protein
VQIWWVKNDTAAAHIRNMKMTVACIYDRKRTYLRKNVQIWRVKNDTAAYRNSVNDKKRALYICVKKCKFGGSKMTQQQF